MDGTLCACNTERSGDIPREVSSLFQPWQRSTKQTRPLQTNPSISMVPVNSPHKGQWRGALMFSLVYAWINDWVYNSEACDLRRHRGHYDVNVMTMHDTTATTHHQIISLCCLLTTQIIKRDLLHLEMYNTAYLITLYVWRSSIWPNHYLGKIIILYVVVVMKIVQMW